MDFVPHTAAARGQTQPIQAFGARIRTKLCGLGGELVLHPTAVYSWAALQRWQRSGIWRLFAEIVRHWGAANVYDDSCQVRTSIVPVKLHYSTVSHQSGAGEVAPQYQYSTIADLVPVLCECRTRPVPAQHQYSTSAVLVQ